jgi:aminoglycoside phosphotransferase (APT) family kinase protein
MPVAPRAMTTDAQALEPATPADVLAAWGLDARRCTIAAVGDGNISTSLRVTVAGNGERLLQRINRQVFPDPLAVVENQQRVIAHLARVQPPIVVPLIATASGAWHHVDAREDVWRLQPFLHRTRSFDALPDASHAAAAAAAFGAFQGRLADMRPDALKVAIPHFHELAWHLDRLDDCVQARPPQLAQAADECRFVAAYRARCAEGANGPSGVIHADCKVGNLLFAAASPRVTAVIDLDTVMHGRRAWDFGDLVRSVLSGDERQATASVSLDLVRQLARSFIAGGGDAFVGDRELREAMAMAPLYITFMLGVRFLVDHLEGGRYFRQRQIGDNLARARAQFALARELNRNARELSRIVARV